MNNRLPGLIIAVICAGFMLSSPAFSAADPETEQQTSAGRIQPGVKSDKLSGDFATAVNRWMQTLSQEQGFETWKDAVWDSYPLGPGTHGWIVWISKDAKTVGYLVIFATPEGRFQLMEYGVGDRPLFKPKTLTQTLDKLGLSGQAYREEKIYIDSFHAVWKIKTESDTYFVDAKTGELLPLNDELVLATAEKKTGAFLSVKQNAAARIIKERLEIPAFDPFERVNWLTHKPIALRDLQELQLLLHHETQVTFAAQLFQHTVLAAFAVVGYHNWESSAMFVALDQEGTRFIPFRLMERTGGFYQ